MSEIRYGIDSYSEWVKNEGIPVIQDYGIDLFQVETAHWPRLGVKGAAVHLRGGEKAAHGHGSSFR